MACRRYGGPMTDELPDNPQMDEAFMAGMRPSRRGRSAELLTIADSAAAHEKRPYVDTAELLYDEKGRSEKRCVGNRCDSKDRSRGASDRKTNISENVSRY